MLEKFNASSLLDLLTHEVSLALIAIMLVSFLFGLIFGLLSRGRKVRSLKKEVRMKDDLIEELKKKIDELTEAFDLKIADLQKVSLEADDLRAKSERLERENQKLHTKTNTDELAIQRLSDTKQTYADTIEGLTAKVDELKVQNVKLSEKIAKDETAVSNIAEMQSLYGATRQKLEALEGKVDKLQLENTHLEAKLSSIKAGKITIDTAPDSFDEQAFQTNKAEVAKVGGRLVTMRRGKDDLTLINGIGPFIAQKLNEIGVSTYEEISRWDNPTIEEVTKKIQFFPNRIQEDNWVGQAARLSQMKIDNPAAFAQQGGIPSNPKDLKVIQGIGPKVEELLRNKGIRTWAEVAATDVETLHSMLRDADYGHIDPSTWPEQARLAAHGEWSKLRQYQDYLISQK
ncbi:MAG: helix-hairpin-helix domain-containing protein [Bacteroidota bacterium]